MPEVQRKVKLINYPQSTEEIVSLAAKMCYSSADVDTLMEKVSTSEQESFVNKIISMGHESVLEHVSFTFAIEGVSRSLLAQITRHRIASFSVKSQRYVNEKEEFNYIIPPLIKSMGEASIASFEKQMEQIYKWYKEWNNLFKAVCGTELPEDARFVLPNAAETKLVVTMNIRELLHFFKLRCCERAQWEIRELACEMLELVREVSPIIFKGAGAPCKSCKEGEMSCKA